MTTIVSAFPGTGKSHFCLHTPPFVTAADSDSSQFSWVSPGVRNSAFPGNYIAHVQGLSGVDYVFVSTHKLVREALIQQRQTFALVFPHESCKAEYIQRYLDRGSSADFANLLSRMWDVWIAEMRDTACEDLCRVAVVLGAGQYISNVIDEIGPCHS